MSGDALREFEDAGNDLELSHAVELLEQYSEELSDEQIFRLWSVLQSRSHADVDYGPDFDLRQEVEMQIKAVHAMRASVLTPGGQMRVGVPAREMKEVVTASSTLLTMLMKTHKEILSYDRQRAIEEAVATAVQTLPEEAKEAFFEHLKTGLAAIS